MNNPQLRVRETCEAIGGPLARLARSLQEDRDAVTGAEAAKSGHDLLATDAFLQRFQQVTDLALRKLFPRLLAMLEQNDQRHPLGAMLDRLDGLEVIADSSWWIALNETRNRLIHEYAMSVADRHRELAFAGDAAVRLHATLVQLRDDRASGGRLLDD